MTNWSLCGYAFIEDPLNPMETGILTLSRKDREREDRRRAMIRAAREVFAEKGYVKATIDEIAQRAEFGKGTLYNYFSDGKEALLVAVFDEVYDGLCELIRESFTDKDTLPFRSLMHAFIQRSFDFFSDQFDLFLILVKEAQRMVLSPDSARASYFLRQQDRILDALAKPLERAMARGDLRKMSPHLLAHLLFINIKGCQMRQCMHATCSPLELDSNDSEKMADTLTDFILDGVNPVSS